MNIEFKELIEVVITVARPRYFPTVFVFKHPGLFRKLKQAALPELKLRFT